MLEEMDTNGDRQVDRGEFLKFILVAMGKCDREDIDRALSMFDVVDAEGAGVIDVDRAKHRLVRSFSGRRCADHCADEHIREHRVEHRDAASVSASTAARDGAGGSDLPALRAPLLPT